MIVNLKEKPFELDEEAIQWVENTISGMTLEEKIDSCSFVWANVQMRRTSVHW